LVSHVNGKPNSTTKTKFFKINNVINEFYPYINSINDLNNLTCAVAILALKLTNQEPKPIVSNNLKNTPAWKTRIQNKINTFRKHLSQLAEINRKNQNLSNKLKQIKNFLYKIYQISSDEQLVKQIEILKQKISAQANRIKRYETRNQFYFQNKQFNKNRKSFFRSLNNTENQIISPQSHK
jgi:hypothetical protein